MADRGKTAGSSRRRFGGDDEDEDGYDVPDYVTARRSSRRADGDRSSLVTAGTGHRADGRTAAGFDETDPDLHAAYGHGAAGYDGYDAAADTRVSGPMGAEPGTGPYATGGYDTGAYDAGSGPSTGTAARPRAVIAFPAAQARRPGRRFCPRPGRRFSPRPVSGVRPGGYWRQRDVPAAGPLPARGPGRGRLRRAGGQDPGAGTPGREAAAALAPPIPRHRPTTATRRPH